MGADISESPRVQLGLGLGLGVLVDRHAPLWARTYLETEAKSQRANFTGEKTCLGQI